MIHMVTREKEGKILYRASSTRKFAYGAVLLFLVWGTVTTLRDPSSTGTLWIPLLLIILCLAGISYRESWSFEPKERRVVSLFGFGPFVKRSIFPYDEISKLSLTHFVKGDARKDARADRKRHKKAMVVFSLVTRDDEEHTIEIIPERTSLGRTEQAARRISSFCDLSLEIDRPMDQETDVGFSEI